MMSINMDMSLTWGNNSGFGQNNVMALCVKNQEPKGSAWRKLVNLSTYNESVIIYGVKE